MPLSEFIPEALRKELMRLRRPILGFTGPINEWQQGYSKGLGYDNPKLVSDLPIKNPLNEKLENEVSDRESRLGLALAKVFLEKCQIEKLKVLDFGGASGSHYLLAKSLDAKKHFDWKIIETSIQVSLYSQFSNNEVVWQTEVSDEKRTISLASGAVQYAENAHEVLDNFIKHSEYIILDRLSLNPGSSDIIMKQNYWSRRTGRLSYPCWYFSKEQLLKKISLTHELLATWQVPEDSPWVFGKRRSNSGFMFARKNAE